METEQKHSVEEEETQELSRKPYQTPELIIYGSLEKITHGVVLGMFAAVAPSGAPSDRNIKEHFTPIDAQDILTRLATLPIETWNYKTQDSSIRHIGPMAQDFAAAFGVGEDDKHINVVDANGVAIASIQALYRMLQERDLQMAELRAELDELKRQLIVPQPQAFDTTALDAQPRDN
jgi:Chaperone of endosialidase